MADAANKKIFFCGVKEIKPGKPGRKKKNIKWKLFL